MLTTLATALPSTLPPLISVSRAAEFLGISRSTGYDLAMTASVNGQELSRGDWCDAQFGFAQMVERASADVRLRPGDLLGSGTVGTGCLLEIKDSSGFGRWLEPGDSVTLWVERLGALTTPIVERPVDR